jgi:urease accessory protein
VPAPIDDPTNTTSTRWSGHLRLHCRRDGERSVMRDGHDGPLRVLRSLYPEGPGICHQVLVHPPGGLVGGDRLAIELDVDAGAHALITSAGASRFYRSAGALAEQDTALRVAAGGRVEWLPLESIGYDGCVARNRLRFTLAEGAQMLGWDLLALGLPAAAQPFARGQFEQHIEWPGVWRERGFIDATDRRLLASPLGLGGRSVSATLWFASGTAIDASGRAALLDAARAIDPEASVTSGATAPNDRMVVLRALAGSVEPAMRLLRSVWATWRRAAWGLAGDAPRVWRT